MGGTAADAGLAEIAATVRETKTLLEAIARAMQVNDAPRRSRGVADDIREGEALGERLARIAARVGDEHGAR